MLCNSFQAMADRRSNRAGETVKRRCFFLDLSPIAIAERARLKKSEGETPMAAKPPPR
jgi:hypothetical protein